MSNYHHIIRNQLLIHHLQLAIVISINQFLLLKNQSTLVTLPHALAFWTKEIWPCVCASYLPDADEPKPGWHWREQYTQLVHPRQSSTRSSDLHRTSFCMHQKPILCKLATNWTAYYHVYCTSKECQKIRTIKCRHSNWSDHGFRHEA